VKRIVVGISGATGSIYGIKLLESLKSIKGVETHLILSSWANKNIELETSYSIEEVTKMADWIHDFHNLGAPVASGSFLADGMVIAPCSMKTLSSVAHGYADNLISRAADVMLKERRRLVMVVRETPLNAIHLENMLKLSHAGAIIAPPMPAFYNLPQSIDDIVKHQVGRVLDMLGIKNNITKRWSGETELNKMEEKLRAFGK